MKKGPRRSDRRGQRRHIEWWNRQLRDLLGRIGVEEGSINRSGRVRHDGERNRRGFCGTLGSPEAFSLPHPEVEVRTYVESGERHAYWRGRNRCQDPYTCPACAPGVRSVKAAEIARLCAAAEAAGWSLAFLTLTVSHSRFDDLRDLRRGLSEAMRQTFRQRYWKDLGVEWVKTFDYTDGGPGVESNGGHPHLHIILFFPPAVPASVIDAAGHWLASQWPARVARSLGEAHRPNDAHGVDFSRVASSAAVARYAAKVNPNLDLELMDPGAVKRPRKGPGERYSMWEVLLLAAQGEAWARSRAVNFYQAMKGVPLASYSKGLRAAFPEVFVTDSDAADLPDELLDDAQVAADAPDSEASVLVERVPIPVALYELLERDSPEELVGLLEYAEDHGAAALRDLIREWSILLGYMEPDPPPIDVEVRPVTVQPGLF